MELFESKDGKLIWNSGDTRGLQLTVNETEYNSASSTSYSGGGYQFNGFNEGKQDPAQLNHIEIAPGIKAIVWAIDVWKELDGGRWDSNYDLFYRVLDTTSGEFLTEEKRLTNDFSSDYVESIKADENGGFQIVWENTTNEYPFQIEVNANEAGAYLESDITSNAPELESKDGKLIWNSGDTRGLQLTVNETEYNSASSTSYSGGGYQFNGFNEGKQDPAQLNHIEIAPGIKAIVWAIDVWKELDGGRWDSNYDLFYRVLDTTSGEFLTEEKRLTNDFSSDYVESIKADENGGFQIVWENTTNEYPFQIEVNANEAGAYLESDITSNAPELESKDGKLIWNSGDARGLQLTVNETEYNSASSTSYSGGGYQFNGFNEGKQDPAQLNHIEIAPGIKAIVWAIDVWKELDGGRWDSNYDLFYRVLDTTSGEFLTEEKRLTNDFSSDYVESIKADENGGFQIVWSDNSNFIQTASVTYSDSGEVSYQEVSGEVRNGSSNSDTIYGTDEDDIIYADEGDDLIFPGEGQDIVFGGKGFDIAQVNGNFDEFSLTFQSSDTLVFQHTNSPNSYDFRNIERVDFNFLGEITSYFLDPYWDFEKSFLGSNSDFLFGSSDKDYISTGGGDDKIMSAGGDDVVVVQGQGAIEVDTGEGDDRVIVKDGWSGTLLVKNGSGSNILEIGGNQENFDVDIVDGKVEVITGNGSTITIDEQHSLNTQTGLVEISDKGFEYIKIDGYDDEGLRHEGEDAYSTYIVLGSNDANYLVANQPDDAESNDEVYVGAGDGADIIEASAHNVIIEGGKGDDTIRISATSGKKSVFGDIFNGDSGNIISSQNSSYADVVEIAWGYDASLIEQVAHGYRITNSVLDAVVEVYDVEVLKFATGDTDNPWDIKYLTAGAPVGKDNWMNGHADKDIAYGDGSDIRFVLGDGTAPEGAAASSNGTSDILQVYANVTTVTQQTYVYYQRGAAKRTTPAKGWARKTGTRDVESSEEALIWEGDRTSVDAFNFSDGVSINVINVADTTWSGEPIYSTIGTEGVDIIFGNDSDNLIDGKGGDDIIFGGDGDDVIIGGEGDDILVGGDGDDTIRGDGVDADDVAIGMFEDAGVTVSELSLDDSGIMAGNDTILGGDGVDDIESGEGKNVVASGRADMDGDGEADLDTIKEHMTTNKDIFDDDDWI